MISFKYIYFIKFYFYLDNLKKMVDKNYAAKANEFMEKGHKKLKGK